MPGNCASAANGQPHQIWRARKITASAPAISRPSAVKTRISSRRVPGSRSSHSMTQFVCSGRRRKPRRRNIRSNRLTHAVQDRQSPSYKIQPRNESTRGAVTWRPPRRSKDRNSLISVFSVNSEFITQKFFSSFCQTQQSQGLVTHLRHSEQGWGWQFFQLEVGGFSQLKQMQQIGQAFPGIAIG
jgi:hypothetical protein